MAWGCHRSAEGDGETLGERGSGLIDFGGAGHAGIIGQALRIGEGGNVGKPRG